MVGFEPTTSCIQNRSADQAALHPGVEQFGWWDSNPRDFLLPRQVGNQAPPHPIEYSSYSGSDRGRTCKAQSARLFSKQFPHHSDHFQFEILIYRAIFLDRLYATNGLSRTALISQRMRWGSNPQRLLHPYTLSRGVPRQLRIASNLRK